MKGDVAVARRAAVDAEATIGTNLLVGAVVEVTDLAATRRFYELVFRDTAGVWEEPPRRLGFRTADQSIEFVQRARPRTQARVGNHLAYRVKPFRVRPLLDELRAMGHEVSWWREDHPREQEVASYLHDPSGNLLQIAASEELGVLLDHATIAVEDLELGDLFYRTGLGGQLDHYHGWRMDDVREAQRWVDGDDQCAPWTRYSKYSRMFHETIARPIPQVFLAVGPTRLGLVVASEHVQEPPEGALKGTPRLLLHCAQPADKIAAHLAAVDVCSAATARRVPGIRFLREGASFFLRDPSGNFVQLVCGSLSRNGPP